MGFYWVGDVFPKHLRGCSLCRRVEAHELNHVAAGKELNVVQRVSSSLSSLRSDLARGWASPWSHCPSLTPWALTACRVYLGHHACHVCPCAGERLLCSAKLWERKTRIYCDSFSVYKTWEVCKEQFDQFFFPLLIGFVSIDHLPVVCQSETVFFK